MIFDYNEEEKKKREEQKQEIYLTALALIDIPYKFGAEVDIETKPKNITGIDCSELVEYCFRRAGIYIPDGAENQWKFSIHIFPKEVDLCDLAFKHDRDTKKIDHVALCISHDEVIEAEAWYGRVVRRSIDKFMNPSPKAKGQFDSFRRLAYFTK